MGEGAFAGEEGANRQSGYSSSKRAMTRNNVSSKKSNFPGGSQYTIRAEMVFVYIR